MAKKNPYLFTIGFNTKDPDHVQVANLLNEQGKGNIAAFLVRAVMAYQGGVHQHIEPTLLESMVSQIVIKQMAAQPNTLHKIETEEISSSPSLNQDDRGSILKGLAGFRKG
jgi:hypothetical protein